MPGNHECRLALTPAFEEAALALAGVVASYPIPDEAVWDLARALDLIHERACCRCGATASSAIDGTDGGEHPAIVHLLRRLGDRLPAAGTGAGSCRRNA